MRLLLAVSAWRLVRRLAAPAIAIALATLLLRGPSFACRPERYAVGAVEHVFRPLERDVRQAFGKVVGP